MKRNRREVLLKEYEVCQQHNDPIGSQVWTSTSILLSINVALLGWFAYVMSRNIPLPQNIRWLVLVVGLGIIAIFHFWKRWLNRMQFLTSINYERMRKIEDKLGMWKNWMIHGLDDWDKLSDKRKKVLAELRDYYPSWPRWKFWKKFPKYAPPAGFEGLRSIAWIVIVLWVTFIVLAFTL